MFSDREYDLLLKELVSINSVSPMDQQQIATLSMFFERFGFEYGDNYWLKREDKANTWVYAHVDTKPLGDVDLWSSDPLVLTERHGCLFGRGVSDAKFQLLNALNCFNGEANFIIDGAEESGGTFASEFMRAEGVRNLVVVDGSTEDGEIFGGLRGQLDGDFVLDTGRLPLHPGRIAHWDILDGLQNIRTRFAGKHFNLTRLHGGSFPRSMTLEKLTASFDIRFEGEEESEIMEVLNELGATLRQNYPPVCGTNGTELSLAPFSNPLGIVKCDFHNVWVIPGGLKSNGAHQINEHIEISQIESHRKLISNFKNRYWNI